MPNYAAFQRDTGWGALAPLEAALALGWDRLFGGEVVAPDVRRCLAQCEAVTPDTEQFVSRYTSAALDAATCCAYLLELLEADDVALVVYGARLAVDTVDLHVDAPGLAGDPLLRDEAVRDHPLMQRELARQREDLALLRARAAADPWDPSDLARRWRGPAVSNLDLPRAR